MKPTQVFGIKGIVVVVVGKAFVQKMSSQCSSVELNDILGPWLIELYALVSIFLEISGMAQSCLLFIYLFVLFYLC